MKKLIATLVLGLCFVAAKAQTPKILISYDANGNRVLREYVPARPAPPAQEQPIEDVLVQEEPKAKSDAASSLAEIAENSLKVYPNPSADNFNVVVSNGILNNNAELVLIDQLGREHQRRKITGTTTTISTQGMADGVYSIVIQYGDNKSTLKIVKAAD